MKNDDITILILSCDKYADLWNPFFTLFRKHWRDCPYPVVLGSNTKNYTRHHTILSGPDHDWSSSLKSILSQITTPYVFVWLDDIFPISPVNNNRFAEVLRFMRAREAKHIHIYPIPKPDRINGNFGIFDKGAPYRSTALGFWDKEYLNGLLLPGESPWKFEVMGSYRTSYTDGFYCAMKPIFRSLHVIEKGRIFRYALDYCAKHGIKLSGVRPINAGTKNVISRIQSYYFNNVIRIPWRLRLGIMNSLRKLLISY